MLLLPGFAAARALDRGAGRHQRGEELSERRRLAFTGSSTTRSRAAISASREANVHRLAEVRVNIIDQCVAQGVPFAREYGGLLDNRSFGGAQVSRTFYARGQTGQQLLLGAYSGAEQADRRGHGARCIPRTEMLDLVVVDGQAKGIVVRDLVTGEIESHAADAVVLATGGYGNVFYLSTNAQGLQRHGDLARLQARARSSRIRATRRFIRRAFPSAATISRSSR